MTGQKYSEIYFGIFRIFGKIFIMLEQITGEVVTEDQTPNSKLSSLKKKVKTMDTELRSKVPVSQVKKEDKSFVDAMNDQYKNKASDAAKYRLKLAAMSKKK